MANITINRGPVRKVVNEDGVTRELVTVEGFLDGQKKLALDWPARANDSVILASMTRVMRQRGLLA